MELFLRQSPVIQALIAGLFTWGVTALGSSGVFLFPKVNKRVFNGLLGFAAGVMIAASFWSLLAPSIELTEKLGGLPWVPPAIGFLAGGLFLAIIDRALPHLHLNAPITQAEGVKASWNKTMLLFTAITLHNIPEGLAIGVAFGSLAHDASGASVAGALALAFGIGIQNFPEGFAVSIPFRREGMSKMKSFLLGQASALVEPVAAVIGALLVIAMQPILPYALAFAAGAMIFVTIEEIIPESQAEGGNDIATLGAMLGFVVMMILDVALG